MVIRQEYYIDPRYSPLYHDASRYTHFPIGTCLA